MKYSTYYTNVVLEKTRFNYNLALLFFFPMVALNFFSTNLIAQPEPITTACYCIEEGGSQPNTLFKLNGNAWSMEGNIFSYDINLNGRIEAFAAKPQSNLLYVVDKNVFGIINVNTLEFSVIDYVSNQMPGFGDYGNQLFDDIDAMAYDPYEHVIWAVNRNAGNGPGTEDFLIKIDPDTGHYIPGAFVNGYDYAVIPAVYDGTLGGEVYDVDGIAYSPYTGILYTVQNQEGPGVITAINTMDGGVEEVIYDMGDDDIEGLGMSTFGQLFGTSGDHGSSESSFIFIDVLNGNTQSLNQIDPSGQYTDFESFDCVFGLFDLAMKIELATNPNTINPNTNVSFNITIKNQGDVEIDGYILSAYLPIGLTLNDNGWTSVPGESQKIKKEVNIKISPNQTKVVTLGLKVSSMPPPTLQLAAEISSFYNNTIDNVHGYRIALPDIDSVADYDNNETNIIDNAMTQGGPKINQDEDDHDLVNFDVYGLPHCQSNLNLSGSIINGSYAAIQNILCNGTIASLNIVQLRAGSAITLNNGFTANHNTTLEVMIDGCQ